QLFYLDGIVNAADSGGAAIDADTDPDSTVRTNGVDDSALMVTIKSDIDEWRARLGHLGQAKMRLRQQQAEGEIPRACLWAQNATMCEPCQLGKQTRKSHLPSGSAPSKTDEDVHVDLTVAHQKQVDRGLNSRPSLSRRDALPTELSALFTKCLARPATPFQHPPRARHLRHCCQRGSATRATTIGGTSHDWADNLLRIKSGPTER
ncbi:MAG: hypothetical protein BJ554DRAFT_3345, partial [Olpidium bornovanus]